jgi:muramoyltetrapeptide carboxypeptidase
MKQQPPLLTAGDTIGILAPARKIHRADVEFASELFASWGLKTKVADNIYSEHHAYLSGSDAERLSDVQTLLNDASVNALISARGGYGSTRIVDHVDYSALLKHPKWMIGFSDITAFHLKFQQIGIASIHGTMPVLFSKRDSAQSIESLRRLLFDGECSMEAQPSRDNRAGKVSAEVIGGNLSLILDSLGTESEPDTADKILIVEEIDEYLYRIDRMMTQLRRTGKLKNLKGLVIGHMTDIKESEFNFGENVQQIICNAVRDYTYPVAFRFPTGHENPNLAWINGGIATLEVTESKSSLVFDSLKKNTG